MIINVCCSGSSGSTFFAQLLNSHPDVACGEELGFFSKPIFYYRYKKVKKYSRLIRLFGVSSQPYFSDRSILRNHCSYGIDSKTVWSWVKKANNIIELADIFYSYIRQLTNKCIWAEKTPGNIFLIKPFSDTFPDAKIIHIVRDPRDVVLSLIERGHSVQTASKIWLTSVASIQSLREDNRVLEIRYEDLVKTPALVLNNVCNHLRIEYRLDYFKKKRHSSHGLLVAEGLASWRANPNDGFSSNSVQKYKTCRLDFSTLYSMRITKAFSERLGIEQVTVTDLMDKYGYDLTNVSPSSNINYYTISSPKAHGHLRLLNRLLGENKPIPLAECENVQNQ